MLSSTNCHVVCCYWWTKDSNAKDNDRCIHLASQTYNRMVFNLNVTSLHISTSRMLEKLNESPFSTRWICRISDLKILNLSLRRRTEWFQNAAVFPSLCLCSPSASVCSSCCCLFMSIDTAVSSGALPYLKLREHTFRVKCAAALGGELFL